MPEVKLVIRQPLNDAIFVPATPSPATSGLPVTFAGQVLSSGHPPLFYRWYSTLHKAPDQDHVALNANDTQAATDVRGHTAMLDLGSHVITLAAKDQRDDTLAAITQVVYAGLAGGDAAAPAPCIIHVLLARIPAGHPTALSKSGSILKAVAPFKWNDDDYKAINQLRYVWRFEPRGDPPARRTAELRPETLGFQQATSSSEPLVQYSGPLPATVDTGSYRLVLRVEHKQQPNRAAEQQLDVTIGV